MDEAASLEALQQKRKQLWAQVEALGDFRRGSLSANCRKCGKANCRCARPGDRGLDETNMGVIQAREPMIRKEGVGLKKIAQEVLGEAEAEIERLAARVLGEWQRQGQPDLEAGELAVRASMHRLGGRLLEQLLGADGGGYQGARIDCGQGHEAQFKGYRHKQLSTVLGAVRVRLRFSSIRRKRRRVRPS